MHVTEQELDDCIKSLFKIFVIGNDPCLMFLIHLEIIILLLLELHTKIAFSPSHLRDPVKQILVRYLKHLDTSTAVKVLRAFILSEIPSDGKSRMKLLHKDLIFVLGEEGGVKTERKVKSDQSFTVLDDEKSIILQVFLVFLKCSCIFRRIYFINSVVIIYRQILKCTRGQMFNFLGFT